MPVKPTQLAMDWDQHKHKPFTASSYTELLERIDFYTSIHYTQYIPTQGPLHPAFDERFASWLGNTSDESHQKTMIELVPRIFFVGQKEMFAMFQSAVQGPIAHWVIRTESLDTTDPSLVNVLNRELLSHTWYCPITDSLAISEFHHATNIGGVDYRPEFRSLAQFGDKSKVLEYMQNNVDSQSRSTPLKRIVLLEDFVGVGSQVKEAIDFAASLDPSIQVLFLPMIIGSDGAREVPRLIQAYSNVEYSPIIELPESTYINSTPPHAPNSLEWEVKQLCFDVHRLVEGNNAARPRPYGPYGVGSKGAMIVMFTNTPANTLPILQHKSNSWNPLFERSARVR